MVFNAWRSRAGAGGVFAAMSGLRSRSCSFVQKIAIIEVHGYQKQGSGYGYSKVRGLNVFIATMKTVDDAPIILAQRLRRDPCWSPRGADRPALAFKQGDDGTIRVVRASVEELHRVEGHVYLSGSIGIC